MTELERKALLGDREAQKECTEKGIVLPCQFCGGAIEQAITSHVFKCKKCGCVFNFPLNMKCFDTTNFVKKINTRPSPPIGRCGECKHFINMECTNEALSTDHEGGASYSLNFDEYDYCSYFEIKGV